MSEADLQLVPQTCLEGQVCKHNPANNNTGAVPNFIGKQNPDNTTTTQASSLVSSLVGLLVVLFLLQVDKHDPANNDTGAVTKLIGKQDPANTNTIHVRLFLVSRRQMQTLLLMEQCQNRKRAMKTTRRQCCTECEKK